MRGLRFIVCSVMLITGILVISTDVLSYSYPRTSIRLGFGAWDVPDTDPGITRVAGLSASLAFSRMLGKRYAWELSVGGFSDSESHVLSEKSNRRYYDDEYYETIASTSRSVSVFYIAVGLIYYPLSELGHVESNFLGALSSFARPYLTAGIGYYEGFDISWNEHDVTDVYIENTMGVYPGVGLDLMLSRHFIFNVDLRYHFVDFSEPLKDIADYSGMNVVAGFKVAF